MLTIVVRRSPTGTSQARVFPPLVGLLPLALALALWELLGPEGSPSFPSPSAWWASLLRLQENGLLAPATAHTLRTFALALVAATLIGVALGTAMGASRRVERALGPLTELARTFPPPAVVPIGLLVFGPTLGMSVGVVVVTAMWPIVINTMSAVQRIPRVRIEAGLAMGLTAPRRLVTILLPSVLPNILLGIRVATPICFIVTLLTEMLASTPGLGQLLLERQRVFDAAAVFALLALVGVIGLAVNIMVGWSERGLTRRWPTR